MNLYNKKIKIADLLFFFAWTIYLISYTFFKLSELSVMFDLSKVYKYIQILVGTIFLIKIIFVDKHRLKDLLIYFAIIVLFLINAYFADTEFLLFILLIVLASKNIDFKKFVQNDIKIRILLLFIIIFLCLIGFLPNFSRIINGIYKQSFGFAHPNVLCTYVVTILLEILYLNKKINLIYIIFNIFILSVLYYFCNSRTSIYAYIIVFIMYIGIKNKEKFFNHKKISRLFCGLPIILFLLSIFCIYLYGIKNEFIIILNNLLTTRISSGYRFFSNYGITLFGSPIKTISTRAALLSGVSIDTIDMGYLKIAINNGLLISLVIIGVLVFLQKNAIKTNNYKILLISTYFIIVGFAEANICNVLLNFSFVSLFYLIDLRKKQKE